MAQQTIFVLESRHRWTPELQRQFSDEGHVHVRGIRTAASVGDHPPAGSVIVADLESAATESLALLETARLPVLVVSAIAQASLEWPVRELGAVAYLTEPVSGEDLAAMCRKVLKSHPFPDPVSTHATTSTPHD